MGHDADHRAHVELPRTYEGALEMDGVVAGFRRGQPELEDEPLPYLSVGEQVARYKNAIVQDIALKPWSSRQSVELDAVSHRDIRAELGLDDASDELGDVSKKDHRYVAYLAKLRQQRQEQAKDPYVVERLAAARQAPTAAERKRLYLEAVSFSPNQATEVLNRLNEYDKRLFTDDQIRTASSDPRAFEQAVHQGIIRNPGLVVESLDIVRMFMPLEAIKKTLAEAIASDLSYLAATSDKLGSVIRSLYPDEAERERIIISFADANPSAFIDHILSDTSSLGGLFSDAGRRKLARHYVFEKGRGLVSQIETGLQKKYWELAEIDAYAKRLLAEDPGDYRIGPLMSVEGMLSAETIEQYRANKYSNMIARPTDITDWDIKDLDDKRRESIFATVLERDRAAVLNNLPHTAQSQLPKEALRELCLTHFDSIKTPGGMDLILGTDALTHDDKQTIIGLLAQGDAEKFLDICVWNKDDLWVVIGSPVLNAYVRQAFSRLPRDKINGSMIESLGSCFEDKAELKALIAEQVAECRARPELLLNDDNSLFTVDEKSALLDSWTAKAVTEEWAHFGSGSVEVVTDVFGVARAKQVLDTLLAAHPGVYEYVLADCAYMYEEVELSKHAARLAQTDTGRRALLYEPSLLAYIDGDLDGVMAEWLKSGRVVGTFILESDRLQHKLGHDVTQGLMRQAIQYNPAYAIDYQDQYSELGIPIDEQSLINGALQDESTMGIAGDYLRDAFGQYSTSKNSNVKNRLLIELQATYSDIATIKAWPDGGEQFKLFMDGASMPPDEMRKAIELAASLGAEGSLLANTTLDSYEALNQRAITLLFRDITGEALSFDAAQSIDTVLDHSGSLAVYASGKKESIPHTEIIRQLMTAAAKGEGAYLDWRFGGAIEELASLQEAQLLPGHLTQEQFSVWRQESVSTAEESFALEASHAAASIKDVLLTSTAELDVEADEVRQLDDVADRKITEQIAAVGRQVSHLHKELQMLRSQPDKQMAQVQIDELEAQVRLLDGIRARLQVKHDVFLLASLRQESIVDGVVGKRGNKKGTPLENVLKRLSKNLPPEASHVVKRVQYIIDGYKLQTGQTQNITISDTVDLRTTLEVGSSPVESCQHYRSGQYNKSLLGYTDPNTKILVLKGRSGRPIARSILRLLSDRDEEPCLHMEVIYTAQASESVTRAMQLHAIKKAEAMGVPLYTCATDEATSGGIVRKQAHNKKLVSHGSRAPSVYVDSAGGPKVGGVYTIDNLAQLTMVGLDQSL